MVIVWKSGNWNGPNLGKTVPCTIVGVTIDVDGQVRQEPVDTPDDSHTISAYKSQS